MRLTSSANAQLKVDTVANNHEAHPPPPEPPPIEDQVAHWWQDFIYNVPFPKVHKCCQYLFPFRTMVEFATLDCAPSPTTPFKFPIDPVAEQFYDGIIAGLPKIPPMMDSVMRITSQPWVCGLVGDLRSTIRVMLLAAPSGHLIHG